MKALIQRVAEASVEVDGKIVAEMGSGLLVLLGVTHNDTLQQVKNLARKIAALRIFEDDAGLMNRSVIDCGGSIIVVSQFTLYGDTRKGNRPSFSNAALPHMAEPLYEAVIHELQMILGEARVGSGVFGAMMKVRLLNAGPVTIEIVCE